MTDSKIADNLTVNLVSMNYRYVAAWNELNVRISLRQNVVSLFITLSSGVIGLLSSEVGDIIAISALMPCVAVACTFLYKKHDSTIALLRNFLAECETFNIKADSNDLSLIGYNSSHYLGISKGIRKLHDVTFLLLVALFNAVGGYVAYQVAPNDNQMAAILIAFYTVAAITPWFILYARFDFCQRS